MKTRKKRGAEYRNKRFGYILIIPSAILVLLISIFPLFYGIYISFTNRHFLKPEQRDFIGLENYAALMKDSEFFGTLRFTFIYTICIVIVSYLIGLLLALLLNEDIRGRGLYRALILIPWVIPPVVAMTNWLWLMNDQTGFFNAVFKALGLIKKPILFFAKPSTTRVTVIIIGIWKSIPFMMITLLAGLQSIPSDLYESAAIDGAGILKQHWYLTLPLLRSVSFIVLTLMSIWTFNNFENIWLLVRGGPANATFTLPILTYYTSFYRSNVSYAAAIASTMMIVLMILCIINLRIQYRDNDDEKVRRAARMGKRKE